MIRHHVVTVHKGEEDNANPFPGDHAPGTFHPGQRVRMVCSGHPRTGTVDGAWACSGVVHVRWDDGRRRWAHVASLTLLPPED